MHAVSSFPMAVPHSQALYPLEVLVLDRGRGAEPFETEAEHARRARKASQVEEQVDQQIRQDK